MSQLPFINCPGHRLGVFWSSFMNVMTRIVYECPICRLWISWSPFMNIEPSPCLPALMHGYRLWMFLSLFMRGIVIVIYVLLALYACYRYRYKPSCRSLFVLSLPLEILFSLFMRVTVIVYKCPGHCFSMFCACLFSVICFVQTFIDKILVLYYVLILDFTSLSSQMLT